MAGFLPVEEFVYLGSLIHSATLCSPDISCWMLSLVQLYKA